MLKKFIAGAVLATVIASPVFGQGRVQFKSDVINALDGGGLAVLADTFQGALVELFGLEMPDGTIVEVIPSGVPGNFAYIGPHNKIVLCIQSPRELIPAEMANIPLLRLICDPLIHFLFLDSVSSPFGMDCEFMEALVAFIVDSTIQQSSALDTMPPRDFTGKKADLYHAFAKIHSALDPTAFSIAMVSTRAAKKNGYQFAELVRTSLVDAMDEEFVAEFIPKDWVKPIAGCTMVEAPEPIAGMPPNYRLSVYRVLGDIPTVESVGANPMTAEERGKAFDELWRAFGAQYPDILFRGIDWMSTYARYRSLTTYCKSNTEFYLVLRRCIASLQDANSRVLSSEGTPMWHSPTGVQVELVDDSLVISQLSEGAPDGLEVGMLIDKVDGQAANDRLADLVEFQKHYEGWPNDRVRRLRGANLLLRGAPNSTLTLDVVNAQGKPSSFSIPRAMPSPAPPAGPIESKLLDDNIGYVKISRFESGITEKFEQSLDAYAGIDGLIIDLRGHESGLNASTYIAECLGRLFPTEEVLGVWYGRNGNESTKQPFRVSPRQPVFPAPIRVLVDGWCFGTGEIFAWCIQAYGRGKLVGQPTAGGVFDPRPIKQIGPCQIFIGRLGFIVRGGDMIEGIGLKPDVEAKITLEDFRNGNDPVLATAVESLRKDG